MKRRNGESEKRSKVALGLAPNIGKMRLLSFAEFTLERSDGSGQAPFVYSQ